mmetsp:Transcript_7319/g.23074  ORF Transcript_7319/g.23074 Transcript_7319/m.23074 type:complete len:269 (+) Transcript_7319:312-1118(+)
MVVEPWKTARHVPQEIGAARDALLRDETHRGRGVGDRAIRKRGAEAGRPGDEGRAFRVAEVVDGADKHPVRSSLNQGLVLFAPRHEVDARRPLEQRLAISIALVDRKPLRDRRVVAETSVSHIRDTQPEFEPRPRRVADGRVQRYFSRRRSGRERMRRREPFAELRHDKDAVEARSSRPGRLRPGDVRRDARDHRAARRAQSENRRPRVRELERFGVRRSIIATGDRRAGEAETHEADARRATGLGETLPRVGGEERLDVLDARRQVV